MRITLDALLQGGLKFQGCQGSLVRTFVASQYQFLCYDNDDQSRCNSSFRSRGLGKWQVGYNRRLYVAGTTVCSSCNARRTMFTFSYARPFTVDCQYLLNLEQKNSVDCKNIAAYQHVSWVVEEMCNCATNSMLSLWRELASLVLRSTMIYVYSCMNICHTIHCTILEYSSTL